MSLTNSKTLFKNETPRQVVEQLKQDTSAFKMLIESIKEHETFSPKRFRLHTKHKNSIFIRGEKSLGYSL